MNTSMLPVGKDILGRVLNAHGEPLDHQGSLAHATRLPLSTLEALAGTASVPTRLLETGIKTLDLLAPIAYGSVVGLIAGFGLGKEVVTAEVMHHLLKDRQGVAVIAGMRETTYDASSLREMVREIEAEERVTMLFEQTTAERAVCQRLLHGAATLAAHYAEEGQEVFLLIDSQIVALELLASLHRFANARGITTLLFVPTNDLHQPTNPALLNELDVQLWFSPTRARQGLWPAIDPLASSSHLLASDVVTLEQRQVAQRVRETLTRYYKLRDLAPDAARGAEEQQTLTRGERIDLFLSQPFVVTETFTEIPGAHLTREETITSFQALLDGRYDDRPAQSFKFVGQIEPNQG